MPVTLINGPAAVVTLDAVKAHLQIASNKDDAVLGAMLAAAQGSIDGPSGWLNRAIGTQTLRLTGTDVAFDGIGFTLPYRPIQSVTEVIVGSTAFPSAAYTLGDGGMLYPATPATWRWSSPPGLRVTYVAGYDAGKVPAPIIMAILLMVQDLYAKRSRDPSMTVDTTIGVTSQQFDPGGSAILTDTAKALLAPYRIWSL